MALAMLSWIIAIPMLGFCTGLRTMTPMAILCWFAYFHHLPLRHSWAFWCASWVTAIVFTILAAGELIGDKLPQTPKRTAPFPLIARIGFGGLVGALAATGLRGAAIEGILLGAIAALVGTYVGYEVRCMLKQSFGFPDMPIALAEDVLTITVSFLALGIVTG